LARNYYGYADSSDCRIEFDGRDQSEDDLPLSGRADWRSHSGYWLHRLRLSLCRYCSAVFDLSRLRIVSRCVDCPQCSPRLCRPADCVRVLSGGVSGILRTDARHE